jgi:hypothetical protein
LNDSTTWRFCYWPKHRPVGGSRPYRAGNKKGDSDTPSQSILKEVKNVSIASGVNAFSLPTATT